jgi:hypothetical protein
MNYYSIILIFIIIILLSLIINCNSIENFENNTNFQYKLCVYSQFKNEGMVIKTWLDHYIWQGVEHFYLVDNGSDDNSYEVIRPYIEKGLITYYNLPEKHKQVPNYKQIVETAELKNTTKWLISCDIDEFFYGYPNKLIYTIDDFDNYDIVYSNWRMFGSDGLENQPEDIRKSIIYRSPELHKLTKYIFKPSKLDNYDQLEIHWVDNMDNKIIENEKIRLNHYPIQSLEYFTKVKMSRGAADGAIHENVRNMDYFREYDKGKTYKDTDLQELLH